MNQNFKRDDCVFIHGILPRSGTNFLRDILLFHKDLTDCPDKVWEFPHLRFAGKIVEYEKIMASSKNLPGIEEGTLLPLFGNALIDYLTVDLPKDKRLVIKEPSVENISLVYKFFPKSYVIILVRDGRDISASSMRTNFAKPPKFIFSRPSTYRYVFHGHPLKTLSRGWHEASNTIIEFTENIKKSEFEKRCIVVKFEDLVQGIKNESKSIFQKIFHSIGCDDGYCDWNGLFNIKVRGSSFVGITKDGTLNWSESQIKTAEFNPIGRWKFWTKKEINIYETIAGDSLRYWGYK